MDLVRLEINDGVGTIRLDRPPLNILDEELQLELAALADEADARDDIRAIVLYGGERTFAAGGDIHEMAAKGYQGMVHHSRILQEFTAAVARIGKPTVAAITGYALGGGCELALAADLRFAADNAQIGLPEVQLGIMPGAGGTQRLARLIGPSRAKELVFTGRRLGAVEALQLGVIDRVYPAAEVYSRAVEWASEFAQGPALAIRAAKGAIDAGLETEIERLAFLGLFATEDQSIGMASFAEHGPGKARFTGR